MDWISHFEGITHNSPLLAIALSFAGGVLASFTPCTYPMMPITVAFIGGKANGSKRKRFSTFAFLCPGHVDCLFSPGRFCRPQRADCSVL